MSIDESIGWARNWIAVVDDEIARMRSSGNHDIALALQAGQKHLRDLIVAAQQPSAQAAQPVSDAYKSGWQAVADDVMRDAERWRLVRERGAYWAGPYAAWLVRLPYAGTFQQAADSLLAAQQQPAGGAE